MRQSNDTGYPLLVAADPPFTVEDGETVDHPEPVAGLTAVEDDADPAAEDKAEARPRRRRGQHDDLPHDDIAEADAAAETPGGQL